MYYNNNVAGQIYLLTLNNIFCKLENTWQNCTCITTSVYTLMYCCLSYHHWCCEFESRSGRGVQHYVIKFVSDLREVGAWFSPGNPVFSTNKTDNVAPVTNLCLGRATTRSHSSQWSKKKLQLKHKNSLFTLQTFHYNYYIRDTIDIKFWNWSDSVVYFRIGQTVSITSINIRDTIDIIFWNWSNSVVYFVWPILKYTTLTISKIYDIVWPILKYTTLSDQF
jgi:hypothetical protein